MGAECFGHKAKAHVVVTLCLGWSWVAMGPLVGELFGQGLGQPGVEWVVVVVVDWGVVLGG